MARWRRHFARPAAILRTCRLRDLGPDLLAGLTVAVFGIPQAIAYASVANLPPSYGLYCAAVACVVATFWGSSRYLSTGPTNAASILAFSVLAPVAAIGSPQYLVAASVMAILVGLFRIVFGLAGLGLLVNFASKAVLTGFTAGAAVLIAAGQLRHLLRLDLPAVVHLPATLKSVWAHLGETHLPSLGFGLGVVVVALATRRLSRWVPDALLGILVAGGTAIVLGVDRLGLAMVGKIPQALPPLTNFSSVDLDLVGDLLTGAMAAAALGLVEAISIARAIARKTGERLDANQEFVGQGLASVAAGLFGGYVCSGSFTRSALNHQAGARTQMANVACGLFTLAGVLAFGPYAAYLPRAALAGLVMLVSYRMIDRQGIRQVLRGPLVEAGIMVATFVATLLVPLEFAVLSGVLISLSLYIYQSSMPRVTAVVPDESYRHFVEKAGAPSCPQLAVMTIRGDLFFGAAQHVEDALLENTGRNPGQHLLLRMHSVNRCDLSGIESLENVVLAYRQAGGDVFLVQVREPVRALMQKTGFEETLGLHNFLPQEGAIEDLFDTTIDPAVCIYECEHRVFAECQALEKHRYDVRLPSFSARHPHSPNHLGVAEFEKRLVAENALLIDVRELSEYGQGHLPGARLLPLRQIIEEAPRMPRDRPIYLVCRSGRRSARAMYWLQDLGFSEVYNLKGGILSWKAHGRPIEND